MSRAPQDGSHLGVKGNGVAGAALQISRLHDGVDQDVVLGVGPQVHQVAVLAWTAENGPILPRLSLVAHQDLVFQIRLLDRFETLEFGIAGLAHRRRPDQKRQPVANFRDPRRPNVGEDLQIEAVLLLVLLMFYTL